MKILWIVNIILPALSRELNLTVNPFGGWLVGLSEQLKNCENIELHIVTVRKKTKSFSKNIDGIYYYTVDNSEEQWKHLQREIMPDVVHIHGTEFNYGLNFIKANGAENVVFSIQGLVSVIGKYYLAGISTLDILKNITLRDILRRDTLFQAQKKIKKRGLVEKELFKTCNYVIGRTEWDKAHTLKLNPKMTYFHGGEILRNSFYESHKWDYKNCEPYTIFLSQAGYPIKGLHQVLKAAYLLKNKYPQLKIKIGGKKIEEEGWMNKLKINGYANYVKNLIKHLNLKNNVEFIGFLSEEQMKEQYLKSNVFVCPSSIENSPNSLAEAQILGVPNVSSYVGGIPDMVNHNKNGYLYRFEEVEMLAFYIDEIFKNKEINHFFEEKIAQRHNPNIITQQLLQIYNSVK